MTENDRKKQESYRDARFLGKYDGIWQTVDKCVFCDLNDKYIVHEEHGIVLTIQLYAYVDGHVMIIPRRHLTSMKELTPTEWEAARKMSYIAKKLIKKVHGVRGMQFLLKDGHEAQSTVEHIHFQCIPFDAPDLSVWNYRKLKYTPLENAALYKQQARQIARLSEKFDSKYKDGADDSL